MFKKNDVVKVVKIGDTNFGRYGIVSDYDDEFEVYDVLVDGEYLPFREKELLRVEKTENTQKIENTAHREEQEPKTETQEKETVKDNKGSTPMIDVKETIANTTTETPSKSIEQTKEYHYVRDTQQDLRASYERALYAREKANEILDYVNGTNTAGMDIEIVALYDRVYEMLYTVYEREIGKAMR